MYDKHRANGAPVPSETEFRAYHLLTLIGTHGRYGYNSSEFQNALLVSEAPRLCVRAAGTKFLSHRSYACFISE